MKRVEFNRHGGPAVRRMAESDVPEPGRGLVQLRVVAAAVNSLDWKRRQGSMKLLMSGRLPEGMGSDVAGVITAVGDSVQGLQAGDEVYGTKNVKHPGAYSKVLSPRRRWWRRSRSGRLPKRPAFRFPAQQPGRRPSSGRCSAKALAYSSTVARERS